jgi:hypothetical protein
MKDQTASLGELERNGRLREPDGAGDEGQGLMFTKPPRITNQTCRKDGRKDGRCLPAPDSDRRPISVIPLGQVPLDVCSTLEPEMSHATRV